LELFVEFQDPLFVPVCRYYVIQVLACRFSWEICLVAYYVQDDFCRVVEYSCTRRAAENQPLLSEKLAVPLEPLHLFVLLSSFLYVCKGLLNLFLTSSTSAQPGLKHSGHCLVEDNIAGNWSASMPSVTDRPFGADKFKMILT
jgi:hypothetical protein